MDTSLNSETKLGFADRIKSASKRIRSLLCMQIGYKLRRRTKEERRKFAFILFLKIFAALIVTAALTAVCTLLQSMFYVPLNRNMLTSILLITQLITIFGDLGSVQRVLFSDKENSLLITFPCRYSDIILSRLILFFLNELKKNCYFLFPFLIGFAITTKQGALFYCMIPFIGILLSAIPIFIDCALSVLFLYGKKIIYSKPILCVASTLVFFSSIFYAVHRILQILPNPLKFLQEYSKYIANISSAADSMAKYSIGYSSMADIMMGLGTFTDFILTLGIALGAAAIGLGVLVPFYFRFLNSISERSGGREKPKKYLKNEIFVKSKKRNKKASLYRTFLRKELIVTLRDSQKLSNLVASFLVLPMISYIMNFILDTINTNPMGEYMVIAFNMMVSASLLAAFNTECAYALSAEGLEFAVLKSSPNNTASIAWSKITITLVSNLVAIGATGVMLYFTAGIKPLDLVLFVATLFLLAAGMVVWSFQLDVRRPLFAEYASKGASGVVDNPNVGLAALIGFIVATIAGALTLLLLYDDYVTGWLRILGIALGFFLARVYLFYKNLHVYFREIEL